MTKTITIELTDTEYKALEYVALPQDWADNALKSRAEQATAELIALNTAHCNANSIQLAVGEAAQVTQAYTLGIAKSLEDRNKEVSDSKE